MCFQLTVWKNIFFDIDIVVKKTNWNVVCRGLYSYLICTLVDSLTRTSWVRNILTTVMTCIIVDKSTDHAKPH